MNYFDEYVKTYDMDITEINYKYYHSYRVMDNMIVIAKSMNLPISDINLAKYIGLLHDIGRFEQFKLYKSFNDINVDHGSLGENILRENKILEKFDIAQDDYEIVYTAIRNHNKFQIENNLPKRALLFSKMLRDADKIDILYAISNPSIKASINEDNNQISKRVNDTFFSNKLIKSTGKENKNEDLLTVFSFVYDINFNVTKLIIKNEKYYTKIYKRLKNKELFKIYIEYLIKYINERDD